MLTLRNICIMPLYSLMRAITCVQFWMALQTCPSYAAFGQCNTSVVLFMYLRFCLTKYFLPFICYFTFWLFLSLKLHECAFFLLHPLQNAGAAVLAWCPAGSALAVLQHAAPCWTTTLRESVFYLADFLSSVEMQTVVGQVCCEVITALLHFLEHTWVCYPGSWNCLHLGTALSICDISVCWSSKK